MKEKGQIKELTGVLFFSITLLVGLMVFGLFDASATNTLSSTSSSTAAVANVSANFYAGANILSVGPLVLAGATILAVLALLSRRS